MNLAGNNSEMGKVSGIFMRDFMKANGLTRYVAMGGMPVVIDGERMNAFFDEMTKEPTLVNLAGGSELRLRRLVHPEGSGTDGNLYPEVSDDSCGILPR